LRMTRIVKALHAGKHADEIQKYYPAPTEPGYQPRYDLQWGRSRVPTFGQSPLRAPSVFNFFESDYSDGFFISEGLVSPEFQILNSLSAITSVDRLMLDVSETVNGDQTRSSNRMIVDTPPSGLQRDRHRSLVGNGLTDPASTRRGLWPYDTVPAVIYGENYGDEESDGDDYRDRWLSLGTIYKEGHRFVADSDGAIIANGDNFLDEINVLFCNGMMSAKTRGELEGETKESALKLLIASPDSAILR